ncbi:MalY/PatB family protein [Desulfosporosinus sp. BICA1-9]|uniref:MalY/PatB family protein n=1 Tax=Desulfosporosinus sp. BICA1-9 TaxID=1531958 RepID=UPI00054B5DB0|nr:MalY/PatB family protein [Desulfosporosinus sp. BICA1-9]KJS50610.1 MAG: cystathionine beta-lyase [Peptococcaceae bacterium BRH_c23]KJS86116.1 MAG: cystathionine beta-lyase [Desulfosporosinus sp. BICA1-9]HBW34360.1 pyridoxal phosphate-dependent aminotransferase [Desulfosporosinus sp.]
MNCDFDQIIDRNKTSCVKWDFNQRIFGREDILPLWVADMDFQAPQAVVEALVNRAQHGIYGYSNSMDGYYEALIDWMKNRHDWLIEREWITFSPGIVPALNELVRSLTKAGDKIILQSPVYPPFFQAIKNHGREVVNNQLRLENGRYTMDFTDLEEKFASGVKMMILCSPHNPVGRVWDRDELDRLGQLCLAYDVLVISDEIHGDLIFEGYRHIPFASLSSDLAQQSIVCTAPSKTFNLAGLQTSNLIIPNPKYRQAFLASLDLTGIHNPNVFGITALEVAYQQGAEWLNQLMHYLEGNVEFLMSFLARELPQIGLIKPEGTYLVWLDFRSLGLEPKDLHKFLVHKAGVGLNAGYLFGPGGEGFARLNLGCSRAVLEEGLRRIKTAVQELA